LLGSSTNKAPYAPEGFISDCFIILELRLFGAEPNTRLVRTQSF